MTATLLKVGQALFMLFMILVGIVICSVHWLYTNTIKLIAHVFRKR